MKKEFEHIDDLLKGTLEGFAQEPSPGVWKRISGKLTMAGRGFYIFLGIIIVALPGLVYITSGYISSEDVRTTQVAPRASIVSEMAAKSAAEESSESFTTLESRMHSRNSMKATRPVAKINSSAGSNEENPDAIVQDDLLSGVQLDHLESIKSDYFSKYPGLVRLSNSESFREKPASFSFSNNLTSPQVIGVRLNYQSMGIRFKDDYGRRLNLVYGIYFMPEIFIIPEDSNNNQTAMNLDLTARYLKNDWFVEGGIGIEFTTDKGIFDVNFSQYDSIGYFYKVSNVTFDEVTGKPVLQTVTEKVYDTVDYEKTLKTDNRYTYLRIPVYAGVRFREFKRFSVYLKAGMVYSALIMGNEPGADYSNDRATQIVVAKRTPGRIHSNLQLSGGIALQYQLSRNIALSFEPLGGYYLKPFYSGRIDAKSPWSIGGRFGMLFKFD